MRTMMAGLLLSMFPAVAAAQATVFPNTNNGKVSLHASAGPTLVDAGNTLSAGVSFTPTPRLTLSLTGSRDHLNYRNEPLSTLRGGTISTVAGEVRFNVAPGSRVSPYLLGGMGVGVSKPNVAGPFQTRVTNSAQTAFAGGGVEIPIANNLSVVADARYQLVAESDSLLAMVPVQFGLAWRF
jgi:Outer membrane protein beta-barrel domain